MSDTPLACRSLRVLVVEDNEMNRAVVVELLHARGHRVTVAVDGVGAIDALHRHRFDAVLMDVQMPVMDGLEATRVIRRSEGEGRPRVAVVGVTANAVSGDRERCLAAGMDAYLSKPIDPAALFAVLRELTDAGHRKTESATSPPGVAGADDGVVVDVPAVMRRTAGNLRLLQRLIGMFHRDAPGHLARIRDAVERRDAGRLREVAHTFKGAAALLGGVALARVAQTLEQMGREARLDGVDDAHEALIRASARFADALGAMPSSGDGARGPTSAADAARGDAGAA